MCRDGLTESSVSVNRRRDKVNSVVYPPQFAQSLASDSRPARFSTKLDFKDSHNKAACFPHGGATFVRLPGHFCGQNDWLVSGRAMSFRSAGAVPSNV
jgi:hypothetical protein